MVNQVILIGYLTKDVETRRLESGAVVSKFGLAINEHYKDKDGNKQQSTEFHNIVVWRGLAEIAEKYLKKGSLIYLEGKITYREYTDKETNQKKYFTEIVANNFKMLDGKKNSNGGGYFPTQENGATASDPVAADSDVVESPANDLPF